LDHTSCHPVSLDSSKFSCLLYADDIVLLSETAEGLQNCLNGLQKFCSSWGLSVNLKKTKILVFNKVGKKEKTSFLFKNMTIENVTKYKYLGVIFQASGCFTEAKLELYNKALKAFFKLRKVMGTNLPNISTMLHIFDHTIVPILLYGSEIWGCFDPRSRKVKKENTFKIHAAFDSLICESLQLKFCKYILGVNKHATNNAVYGELGRYPLYVMVVRSMISYWQRLESLSSSGTDFPLLCKALHVSKSLHQKGKLSWFACVNFIVRDLNLNIDVPDSISVHNILTSLRDLFESKWKKSIWDDSSSKSGKNKLRTYRDFKTTFNMEKYLLCIRNKSLRECLCKFRISAHDLAIERGRYKNLQVEDRVCSCDNSRVEDELHFLMECPHYTTMREHLFNFIQNRNKNFLDLSPQNKCVWILSNEDEEVCQKLASFIQQSLEKRP
ncbi:MAG: hypothetical protein MJA29_08130, partial [Candidatus Omnitrophica bacterium]|nr:hypothetical protein [Candidatus Omnitrophota bacterium]